MLMSPKLSGCHCPGDMAVSVREVLSRPWADVGVPLPLGLSCFANNFLPSHFSIVFIDDCTCVQLKFYCLCYHNFRCKFLSFR